MMEVGGFQATVRMERLWPPVMVERRAGAGLVGGTSDALGEDVGASGEDPRVVGETSGAAGAAEEEEGAGKEVREYIRTVLSAKQVARMGRAG